MQIILGLLAGIALFLFGMSVLAEALKELAGERAKSALAHATNGSGKGVVVGALATAALGSSSLSIIMTIALVDARLLPLSGALAIVLGANIGTTIASQLFALNAQQFGPILLIGGLLLSFVGRSAQARTIGRAVLGVGLLFFGLSELDQAANPLGKNPMVLGWLQQLRDPAMGALVGAGVTVLVQASSATVAIAISFVREGLITLPAGVAVMLGAEIGTCSDTLVASLGRSADAIRVGVFHLIFNVTTVLLALPFASELANLAQWAMPGAGLARDLANAHILFNTLGVLVAIPLLPMATRVLQAVRRRADIVPAFTAEG